MPSPATAESFAEAARRHFHDAQVLRDRDRLANADHLAGFAAEGGLKAILENYLGVRIEGSSFRKHLPRRWEEMAMAPVFRSLTGSTFHHFLTGTNPFQRWEVGERYSDGCHIDAERTDAHLAAAQRILSLHEDAQITGALP
ncbi:hypothetical protein [Saccharopolyspora phatthalungensis]|uniref:HEPN domain-containing protein n=1 Tax=Saccharopolyspora phatthalungensis TaxID=664693 RepID=A0A840Q8T0_9PSEU|nr:hypothetical protein [Saccharopolyspora phatthalungensis]MBB5155019.1 hypothetical protein [Saccharopolyspora phatthalungensis]